MSMPVVIASNQTAGGLLLTRLGLTVPASTTLTLTDFATINEIREDASLEAFIVAGSILLDFGGDGDRTKGESLNFFNVVTPEVKSSVRALGDANIGSLSGTTTIDTVVLAVNDRVLLTAQSTGAENGLWVIKAGAWARPDDFQAGQAAAASIISIQEGGVYANQVWNCTDNSGADIVDTSALAFAQISGGGGGGHTLQAAYDGGPTITTAGATDIAYTLASGNFTVDGAGNVLFGGTTPLGAFNVDAVLGSLDFTDTTNLTMTANDAANKVLTFAASNAGAGTGNIVVSADGTIDVDSVGALSLNSSGAAINIGDDAVAQAINIGTGAAVRTITVGNATGATQLDLNSGTGGTLIDSTGIVSLDGVGNSNFTTDTGNLTLATTTSGGVLVSSVGVADIQAAGAITIDSSGGLIGIGTDADTGAIDIGTSTTARIISIGNNVGATGVAIETGSGNLLIDAPITTLTGNLTVQGTTTTVKSEIVNIADNFLYLNDGYTTPVGQAGGTITNYLPTATVDTVAGAFSASVPVTTNATVVTTGTATFAAGDYIQISGANNQTNDGLYEVLSHVGTTLKIKGLGGDGAPVYGFVQNEFTTDATVAGAITKINVGVTQTSSTGIPQFGSGSDSTFTFNDYITSATLTLQAAYDGGPTILTAGGTQVTISGTEELNITATGGLNLDTVLDFDGTVFDVLMTGANGFSIDGTATSNVSVDAGNLILATTTSGSVFIDGVGGVELNSSGGAINVGNDANTGAINVGTGAAARTITVGNSTGATGVIIDSGTEQVQVDGVTYYAPTAGIPTARAGGFQEGDKHYDTTLDMETRYDATRSKWLSIEAATFQFGRNNNVPAGVYYRNINGLVMSAAVGNIAENNGTIVGLGYTRGDTDAATFDVVEGGTSRAVLASAAVKGKSNALNGDFTADGVLSVQNQAGGNTTSNVAGWFKVRWRSA